nr:mucin-16-like [Aedes albopictus]
MNVRLDIDESGSERAECRDWLPQHKHPARHLKPSPRRNEFFCLNYGQRPLHDSSGLSSNSNWPTLDYKFDQTSKKPGAVQGAAEPAPSALEPTKPTTTSEQLVSSPAVTKPAPVSTTSPAPIPHPPLRQQLHGIRHRM